MNEQNAKEKFINLAISQEGPLNLPIEYVDDIDVALAFVERDGYNIKYFSDRIRKDSTVVNASLVKILSDPDFSWDLMKNANHNIHKYLQNIFTNKQLSDFFLDGSQMKIWKSAVTDEVERKFNNYIESKPSLTKESIESYAAALVLKTKNNAEFVNGCVDYFKEQKSILKNTLNQIQGL